MDSLKNQLKEKFGFTSFKNLQEPIINNLLEGNNSFVIMPTGGGKSLCYQLPAMILDGTAIVVSPLIALMKNQVDLIRSNNTKDSVAHVLNSTLTKEEIEKVKNDVLTKETKLLFVAPETLSKSNTIEFLKKITLSFIAIDEAHCISEWGHDFRPEYRKIRDIIDQISSDIKIIALTATATPKVQDDVIKNLKIDNSKIFKSSFNRHNLYYEVRAKNENTDIDLLKFIKSNQNESKWCARARVPNPLPSPQVAMDPANKEEMQQCLQEANEEIERKSRYATLQSQGDQHLRQRDAQLELPQPLEPSLKGEEGGVVQDPASGIGGEGAPRHHVAAGGGPSAAAITREGGS